MSKINCWEHMKCGREKGGNKAEELGVCEASIDTHYAGNHGGKNGGRKCWHINGTLCGGSKQGSFYTKAANCLKCEFFSLVKAEEGTEFGF